MVDLFDFLSQFEVHEVAHGQERHHAAVIRHRQAGVPMSFEEDGKIVHIPADQIPIDHLPEL